MLNANKVKTTAELLQILTLQKQNLRGLNGTAEEQEQGFVTVAHTLDKLQQMHNLEPSIIVKENTVLAGYALVMPKACSSIIPELLTMFTTLSNIVYKNKPIVEYDFYVMGQICVAKEYRGKGVFDMLYQKHKEILAHTYDFVITEIATRNTRSIRAHERIGFKHLHTYKDELEEWTIVIWDWK